MFRYFGSHCFLYFFFFFNDTATTEIYTLSLHDALPISKHLEVCHLLAERLGGYEPDPGEAGLARASNHPFAPAALDPHPPGEARIAALGALDDQLHLKPYLSHPHHAKDEVGRVALRLIA